MCLEFGILRIPMLPPIYFDCAAAKDFHRVLSGRIKQVAEIDKPKKADFKVYRFSKF